MSTLNSCCQASSPGVTASALTLGTTMSSPPNSSATSSTHWRTAGPSPTSSARPEARTPVAASAETASSTSASVRAQIATSEPSAASSFAIALPIPLVPPVTSDFLPFKPRSMMSSPYPCNAACEARGASFAHLRQTQLLAAPPGPVAARHGDRLGVSRASALSSAATPTKCAMDGLAVRRVSIHSGRLWSGHRALVRMPPPLRSGVLQTPVVASQITLPTHENL